MTYNEISFDCAAQYINSKALDVARELSTKYGGRSFILVMADSAVENLPCVLSVRDSTITGNTLRDIEAEYNHKIKMLYGKRKPGGYHGVKVIPMHKLGDEILRQNHAVCVQCNKFYSI